jgi:formylglycine-generating enzyme required for sulfatase activity
MAKDHDKSLGDQPTFDDGTKRVESSERSLGDPSTFGDGSASSMADLDGPGGDVGLDMEIVDLAARYTTERVLGKGGMGEVLLATDTRLNRKVAIKRMLGKAAKSRTAASRFLTEAQSIAQLDHDNIVDIYDYGRDHDGPFLIMQYIGGGSLLDRCQQGALPLEEAVELTCQLCDGLGKAHEAGVIHRDIKPANVLLTTDGVAKLTDFGLARQDAADTGQTMAGAVLGTLDFMPPEQRRDATLTDARSDLWSLAATLYQMVTGEPPRVIDLGDVPQQLRKTLSRALKTKKNDRFQTAREFRDALQSCLTATDPVPEVAVDLGAGECPQCHTKNEASRKFCSNGTCGGPLRVTCLACNTEIPAWDQVCGDCGGKQRELVSAELEKLSNQRKEAEEYRGVYRFDQAIELARVVRAVEDERLSEHKAWAEKFIASTESEWERETTSTREHYEEARTHREAFDYQAAIHAMQQIPDEMRTGELASYLSQLQEDQEEAKRLIQTIAERVKQRELAGLLVQIDRALELRGDREDLQKLQHQLRDRERNLTAQRDKAFREAADLFESGDAKNALAKIDSLSDEIPLRSSDSKLKGRLVKIVSAEKELAALMKEAKADGVLDAAEVVSLFLSADAYLKMNPRHKNIRDLQTKLQKQFTSNRFAKSTLSEVSLDGLSQLPPAVLSQLPHTVLSQLPWSTWPKIKNSIGMQLKFLSGGTFTMGEGGAAHEVTLSQPFYMGVHEVTQSQYEQVMGSNPSHFTGRSNPVESVSWDDAVKFFRRLSALPEEQAAGRVYRLPTEAEWEYACRAGTDTEYSFGDNASGFSTYAWFTDNSNRTSHPVGKKRANAWGLYDMHGNVWEWCADWYGNYRRGAVTDPRGPRSGSGRVYRGGCWNDGAGNCRSASRYADTPDRRGNGLSFRLVLSPSVAGGE